LELWRFAGVETIAALRAAEILHFTEASSYLIYSTYRVVTVVTDKLGLEYTGVQYESVLQEEIVPEYLLVMDTDKTHRPMNSPNRSESAYAMPEISLL
jgi:hypothetical protein